MTLRSKILLKMGALLGGFALLGVCAVWGFASLQSSNRQIQNEFDELRQIRSIGVRLAADKALLPVTPARAPQLSADLHAVLVDLHKFVDSQRDETDLDDNPAEREHDARECDHANKAIMHVEKMQSMLASIGPDHPLDLPALAELHDAGLGELDLVADECASFLSQVHATTRIRVRAAIVALSLLSAGMLVTATLVGMSVYRSIVLPLRQLNDGVREVAAGHFTKRLSDRGDPEFLAVIHEFNRMAGQLEEFYLRLEEQVAQKSRELVKSERLASVGFLAAGVAHEIRNPLGIISGYAELSLKMLGNHESSRNIQKETRILGVIRDEAFRCKQITDKLLGLVQGGDGRETVDLARVVRDVAFLVKGMDTFRERHAELYAHVPSALPVTANAIEMKQVVLNLTLNALDAVEVGMGKIELEGREVNGHVELEVRDNGCGITRESLEQIFEPFYTSKRGRSAPGTGLGLSISHAIVVGYGGVLRAESEGPGKGSRFTIELPAAQEATV